MSKNNQAPSAGLAALADVLPENRAAANQASTNTADIVNVSTAPVETTPVFDTEALSAGLMARSANAEHLNLTTVVTRRDALDHVRNALAPNMEQLRHVQLPDTKVNIDNIKIEIPYEVKRYANALDQTQYAQILHALLGTERMDLLRSHTTRANQVHTPALWMNQQIVVETKKPYVWTLQRNIPEKIKEERILEVSKENAEKASSYLKLALGGELWQALYLIADTNQLPIYVVFVLLCDVVLDAHLVASVPNVPQNIWDGVTTPQVKNA
jgi:hypothetical protein